MSSTRLRHREYDYLTEIPGFDPVTSSAEVVVPWLMQRFRPQSVVDLGCGTGIWLSVFGRHGVSRLRGCDGSWVPQDKLKIPAASFQTVDFHGTWPAPERFDLALCLEVGEHISADAGGRLVEFLCGSADVVLWSAAIPGQGGHSHINEQYQDYWVGKFRQQDFAAFDLVRPEIWTNEKVSVWYRQNSLIFANRQGQETHGLSPAPFVASVVHPELFERDRDPRNYSLTTILRHLPHYLRRRLRRD